MLHRALKMLRVYYRISQTDLSKKLSLAPCYISDLENNKRTPSMETLTKYSKYFNVPVSTIMFFSDHIDENYQTFSELRIKGADKVLKILEWIADTHEQE